MTTTQALPRVVQRWFDDISTKGSLDAADEILAADFVAYDPAGRQILSGKAAFKQWLTWYTGTFGDRAFTVHDVISAGDKVVVRYSGEVVYQGGFLDLPTRNQRTVEMGILIFEIAADKIKALWSAMNDLELVLGLGARVVGAP